jgi:hypothetical protein
LELGANPLGQLQSDIGVEEFELVALFFENL